MGMVAAVKALSRSLIALWADMTSVPPWATNCRSRARQFIIHQRQLGRENQLVIAQVGGRADEINVVSLLRGGLEQRVIDRADVYLLRQKLVIEHPLVLEVLDGGNLRNDF